MMPTATPAAVPATTPKLADYLDLHTLQHIQDTFAGLAGVIVILTDRDGEWLTAPSMPNDYARLVLNSQCGRQDYLAATRSACTQTLAAGDVLFIPTRGPIRYAAAINVMGEPVGCLHMGDRPRDVTDLTEIASQSAYYGVSIDVLRQAVLQLPPWDDHQIGQTVELLRLLAQTLARMCFQEHQLRERLEELNAIYDISGLLAGKVPLDEALSQTTQRVTEVLGMAACTIRLTIPGTEEARLAASYGMSEQYVATTRTLNTLGPIDHDALRGKMVYVQDLQTDARTRHRDIVIKDGLHSALIAPLMHRGQAIGTMRVYSRNVQMFSGFEAALLRSIASQVAGAVVNYRLVEDRLARANVERQLNLAGEVQRRMIPSKPPEIRGLDIAAAYETSFAVGGDFYDFYQLPNANFGVAIADVAGKGLPAALLMVAVRSAMRIHTQNIFHVTQIMSEINRQVERDTLSSEFATVWYGVIDTRSRILTYVNAGHEAPILLRNGEIYPLEVGGLVVGVDPQTTYSHEVVHLQVNDVLLLVTDGATEATSYSDEEFGRERVREALKRYCHLSADEIVRNIRMDIWRFIGLRQQPDDFTMVCIKVNPSGKTIPPAV